MYVLVITFSTNTYIYFYYYWYRFLRKLIQGFYNIFYEKNFILIYVPVLIHQFCKQNNFMNL